MDDEKRKMGTAWKTHWMREKKNAPKEFEKEDEEECLKWQPTYNV